MADAPEASELGRLEGHASEGWPDNREKGDGSQQGGGATGWAGPAD